MNEVQHGEPYLIQGSDDPVFRCDTPCEATFRCERCSHLLIENYFPDDYLGVSIKCFRCGNRSTTPGHLNGEIFSSPLVTLGDSGAFLIESTVTTTSNVTITCDAAHAEALNALGPRNGLPLHISNDGLDKLVQLFEIITPGTFEKQERILARTNDIDALSFPFTWAIRYLRRCFRSGALNIDHVQTRTALFWLQMFSDAVGSWQHHPRFAAVAKDLGKPNSYLHTVGQLLVAKYLFQHANPIGLSLENKHGEPNPDLYMRLGSSGRVYLEVKAPRKLQSVNEIQDDLGFVSGTLKKKIDDTKGQINKGRKGALVILSSLYNKKAPGLLHRLTENWLRTHGRTRTSLAGIVIVSADDTEIWRIGRGIDQPASLLFDPMLNPHFEGENPFNIGLDRGS